MLSLPVQNTLFSLELIYVACPQCFMQHSKSSIKKKKFAEVHGILSFSCFSILAYVCKITFVLIPRANGSKLISGTRQPAAILRVSHSCPCHPVAMLLKCFPMWSRFGTASLAALCFRGRAQGGQIGCSWWLLCFLGNCHW